MGVFIIAEAGVNHNGSLERALEMVEVAKEAGASAVKFQLFRAERLVSPSAGRPEYQKKTVGDGSQWEMLKGLELSREDFVRIKRKCDEVGIEFMTTPFDEESARFLYDLGMETFKIASGNLTDYPLLKQVSEFGRPVILSTGMATMEEIREALDVLSSGLERDQITLLHCLTEYPAPVEEVNLRAMVAMREAFGVRVGYSDHTLGWEVPIAAVALGAEVIEKHFTLDRGLPGPDHKASLEPEEFRQMVSAIRKVERALGDGIKRPTPSELKNLPFARKSLFARRPIKKGEVFSMDNLIALRPGDGISPMLLPKILGKASPKDYEAGEMLGQEVLEA